jgi:uncharacterized protein (DUF433 family)
MVSYLRFVLSHMNGRNAGMKRQSAASAFIRELDSRGMPRYTFGEAGGYLGLPESTIRSWFAGMPYGSGANVKWMAPILVPAAKDLLSFYDIASAHVLMVFKSKGARPSDIRDIISELEKEYPDARHPLLGRDFHLFGKDVVLKTAKRLLNLSKSRQMGLRKVMDKFLLRIEFDAKFMPLRFSPLRTNRERGKGYLVIDPDFAYGRPVIRGTAIPAEIIANRRAAGESEGRLAKDYRISTRAVKEAVKHFPQRRAA